MIRLSAAVLSVISGSMLGVALCKSEKEGLNHTDELCKFISHIQTEIETKSLPLDKIFADYFKGKNSEFLSQAINDYRGTFGEKIYHACSLVCSDEAMEEMCDFSATLGAIDRVSQKESLRRAKLCMEKELSRQKAEFASKSRLYKTLSFLISCIIAVLLY